MFAQITAKNVRGVFLRNSVYIACAFHGITKNYIEFYVKLRQLLLIGEAVLEATRLLCTTVNINSCIQNPDTKTNGNHQTMCNDHQTRVSSCATNFP